jgi:AraC-like DNA-binding protein
MFPRNAWSATSVHDPDHQPLADDFSRYVVAWPAMAHRYFDQAELAVLLSPGAWSLVASGLPLPRQRIDTPAPQPQHSHAHRELLIALSGDYGYGHPLSVVRCRPGTVLYFDRLELHDNGYRAGATDFCHLWCSITAANVLVREHRVLANGTSISRPLLLPDADEQLGGQLSASLDHWRTLPREHSALAHLHLSTVVATIAARVVEAGWREASGASSRAARAVAIASQHIRETNGVGISLDALAQLTCYSRFHFLRIFQEHAGCSLRDYLDRVRRSEVLRVRKLGASAKDAAQRVGFASPSAFSRWCRRNGITWT